uniref:Uncharacterized protein n=1 Tax=Arundo donax TaxID=35708 RepID=A0A0A9H8V8_ARUDO
MARHRRPRGDAPVAGHQVRRRPGPRPRRRRRQDR